MNVDFEFRTTTTATHISHLSKMDYAKWGKKRVIIN